MHSSWLRLEHYLPDPTAFPLPGDDSRLWRSFHRCLWYGIAVSILVSSSIFVFNFNCCRRFSFLISGSRHPCWEQYTSFSSAATFNPACSWPWENILPDVLRELLSLEFSRHYMVVRRSISQAGICRSGISPFSLYFFTKVPIAMWTSHYLFLRFLAAIMDLSRRMFLLVLAFCQAR